MATTDALAKRLRLLLVLQAIGFFAWQAGDGVAGSDQIANSLQGPAIVISSSGMGLWLATLIFYLGQAFQAKKQFGYDVLNDEWARDVRKKASETAFWVCAIGIVTAMTATNFGADGQLLLKVLTGLAVSSYFLANVYWDTRGEGAEDA